ncbi:MAG: hypothetical protein IPL46_17420 [Saprospiraceae bacterium]|nr:hypothetical protein [Saprospiraceae bacterium]
MKNRFILLPDSTALVPPGFIETLSSEACQAGQSFIPDFLADQTSNTNGCAPNNIKKYVVSLANQYSILQKP